MKPCLATLETADGPHAAIGDGKFLWKLSDLPASKNHRAVPTAISGFFDDWPYWSQKLDEILQDAQALPKKTAISVSDAKLLAPLRYPGKVLCAGANYYDHMEEMGAPVENKDNHKLLFFFKPPTEAVVGPGRTVRKPATCNMLDWEIELAVVIGKRVTAVSPQEAGSAVAAATVAVDMSARDLLFMPDSMFKFDWVAGKANDTHCPMGPWLVPVADLGELQDIGLKLRVNGEVKQDASTSGMIYDIAEQISAASHIMTLNPGDVLLTGTPAGVGMPKQTFLSVGDTIDAEIEGIGGLSFQITD